MAPTDGGGISQSPELTCGDPCQAKGFGHPDLGKRGEAATRKAWSLQAPE